MKSKNLNFAKSQRGIATILIVALVGIALIVSIAGTAYYLRMKQQASVTSHALTNAQQGAWIGVEIVRQYLNSRNKEQLDALTTGDLIVSGITEVKLINIVKPSTSSDPYQITTRIKNISDVAKSASTVEVLYEINLGGGGGGSKTPLTPTTSTFTSAMNFYGGLTTVGTVDLTNAGNKSIINVDGDVKTSDGKVGVSLSGVKQVNSTGYVDIGSNSNVEEVYSNEFIIINGSASVTKIASALKYIKMQSGGWPGQGDLYAGNSQKIALGLIAKNDVYVTVENSSRINSINTLNNIDIINGGANLGTAVAGEQIKCPGTWWGNYTLMKAKSFDISCSTSKRVGLEGVVPLDAIEVSLEEKPIVSALSSQYKDEAQYIFYYDSSKKIEKVDVRNNFTDVTPSYTTYQLDKKNGYLCEILNVSKRCSTPIIKLAPKLKEQETDFIQYDATTKLWTITEANPPWSEGASTTPSFVPSVVLFKGDLKLSLGRFTNTFLATGDIYVGKINESDNEGGLVTLYAPNYAGDNKVCTLSSDYKVQPNFCVSGKLAGLSIANIALLAGSCNDDSSVQSCQNDYTGGTINVGNTATIYGNIIAGNILNTRGDTTIHGAILAAALGKSGSGSYLEGNTKIDLNGISDEKTTIELPSGGGTPSTPSPEPSGTAGTTIKWARYL